MADNEKKRDKRSKAVRLFEETKDFFINRLWGMEVATMKRAPRLGVKLLRVIAFLAKEAISDSLTIRAHALTSVAVLSIVPLFAVLFVVAKGTGMWEALKEKYILDSVAQLGSMQEVADKVLSYVENTNFQSIGMAGIVFLFYTSINLLSQIEKAFNDIWRVKTGRAIIRKITDYTSILIFSPILLMVAGYLQAISSSMVARYAPTSILPHGAGQLFAALLSYVLLWISFAFLFLVLPNRKVPLIPAIAAGIVTGTIYRLVLYLYVAGQIGVARYNAIYSSIAALPLTIIWIDISWLIVLLGCELAYVLNNVESYAKQQTVAKNQLSVKSRELIALRLLLETMRRFDDGKPAPTSRSLAREWGLPEEAIENAAAALSAADMIRLSSPDSAYLPALPAIKLTVAEARSRLANLGASVSVKSDPAWARVEEAMAKTREGANFEDLLKACK